MTVFLLSYSHSHIIVMLADDMACNARNPRPGESFIFPTLFVSPLTGLIMIFQRNYMWQVQEVVINHKWYFSL